MQGASLALAVKGFDEEGQTWLSRAMEVVSDLMALAIPKSMSLSWPSTIRKLAGFRSECTMRSSWIVATAFTRPGCQVNMRQKGITAYRQVQSGSLTEVGSHRRAVIGGRNAIMCDDSAKRKTQFQERVYPRTGLVTPHSVGRSCDTVLNSNINYGKYPDI